jgi:hypothetical protein
VNRSSAAEAALVGDPPWLPRAPTAEDGARHRGGGTPPPALTLPAILMYVGSAVGTAAALTIIIQFLLVEWTPSVELQERLMDALIRFAGGAEMGLAGASLTRRTRGPAGGRRTGARVAPLVPTSESASMSLGDSRASAEERRASGSRGPTSGTGSPGPGGPGLRASESVLPPLRQAAAPAGWAELESPGDR